MRSATRRRASTLTAALLAVWPATGLAQASPACPAGSVERLMERLATQFGAKTLGQLDAERRTPRDPMLIVVEHALVDETESEQVSSFGALDAWLSKRADADSTARGARPLRSCAKGLCVFTSPEGISHNTLYLHRVLYRCEAGGAVVTAVVILDGD